MNADFAKALVKAQAEMPGIEKDSRNPHFKSEFVSLDHLLAEALPVLNRNGIALVQMPTFNEHAQPTLTTTLVHESGDTLASSMPLFLPKQDPQGQGSAITYARRYAAAAALGISSEKDDDGNQASTNAGESTGAAAPKPDAAGSPPGPASSPADKKTAWTQKWNALGLADTKAAIAKIESADDLRLLLIIEGERTGGQRKTVLTAISKRIQELEGNEPEAENATSAVADTEVSVSQNGQVPPADSASSSLQELQACLAFIAEQPGTVDNPSFWTSTNVLVGLSTSGAGEFSSLAEVPEEWLVKVIARVPTGVRELVGMLGPESKAELASQVA